MKKLRLIEGETPAKAVGIWIRVSTEDQARGESPEHYEKRACAYAKAKGWKLREVYHLEAVSGKSVTGHPETKRMLGHRLWPHHRHHLLEAGASREKHPRAAGLRGHLPREPSTSAVFPRRR